MDSWLGQARAFASQTAASAGSAARSLGAAASAGASAAVRDARTALTTSSPAASLVGTIVPLGGREYHVEALLAEGGFGSVYTVVEGGGEAGEAAAAPSASPKLVLKRMFAGSPELATQLHAEVKLMRQLQGHPNIVRVINAESKRVGEGASISVLMELCPGGHLLARLNSLKELKRALPLQKLMEVFLQILRPIAHMHACAPPIAHRDLKVRGCFWLLVSSSFFSCCFRLLTRGFLAKHSLKMCLLRATGLFACATLGLRARMLAFATQRRTGWSRRTLFCATPRPTFAHQKCATCTAACHWMCGGALL